MLEHPSNQNLAMQRTPTPIPAPTHRYYSLLRPGLLLLVVIGLRPWFSAAAAGQAAGVRQPQPQEHFDIVVWSASPAGIAAALAASSAGCTVLLVEPSTRIGGMLTSGLSHTNFRTIESLSGTFLDFTRRVEQYYRQKFGPDSPQLQQCFHGTCGEPGVNLRVLEQMLAESKKIIVRRQLQLQAVHLSASGTRIQQLVFKSAAGTAGITDYTVSCDIAVDASCEGDLLDLSGELSDIGREDRSHYKESLAPEVADDRLQASGFRFILTQDPRNRLEIKPPRGYSNEDFAEIPAILRGGRIHSVFGDSPASIFNTHQPALPNGKLAIDDVFNEPVLPSIAGLSQQWLSHTLGTADRAAIRAAQLRYQVGLLYFLQHHPTVPQKFREEASLWGWCRDEFPETAGEPPRLYIREGRRMQGQHKYIQSDSQHTPDDARALLHADSIACGDSGHHFHGTGRDGSRFDGRLKGEFFQQTPPYQIPYSVIVPRRLENLLVPVAVSASHVGYAALRHEPIRTALGQAAGYAAAQAIQHRAPVQQLDVPTLQMKLLSDAAAVIYVSDVPSGHPDFSAVQWWGLLGGLHGLAGTPPAADITGTRIVGQYFEAFPQHAVGLQRILDSKLAERWQTVAVIAGLSPEHLPVRSPNMTRGDFIRDVYQKLMQTPPSQITAATQPHAAPRLNPIALPGTHAPGDVDVPLLAVDVVRNAARLPGIVVDDCDAELQGEWQYSTHTPPWVGRGYLHDRSQGKGSKSITYRPKLPADGFYEVRLSHCRNIRRATNTLVTIHHSKGETSVRINQQQTPEHHGLFQSLGRFHFNAGTEHWARISNADTDGKYVIADAVQWLPVATP
ncbi:MAG: hypothetical protein RLZZ436_4293 [Planctomycetota bacterium]|jgi:hypothetical protein